MSEQDEIEKRAKAAGLLAKLAGGAKQRRKPTLTKKAKRHLETHNAIDHPRRARKRQALAKAAVAPVASKRGGRPFTLLEMLIIRTEGAKWYTFGQIRKLLPETTTAGVKAIVYLPAMNKGLIERAAIVDDVLTPWDASSDRGERWALAQRPKYRYQIGAEIDTERARLRLKWLAYTDGAE